MFHTKEYLMFFKFAIFQFWTLFGQNKLTSTSTLPVYTEVVVTLAQATNPITNKIKCNVMNACFISRMWQ